jgi:hypothetical protein
MAGCTDLINDTLPNPGVISGNALMDWIIANAAVLANCSTIGVEPETDVRLFAAAPAQTGGKGTVVYDVPKDIADTYGMKY